MVDGISGCGGGMDPAMMEQMRENHFARTDANGDGGIDKAEMQALTDKIAERTGRSINVDDIFARLDANSDGKIDRSEQPDRPPGGRMGRQGTMGAPAAGAMQKSTFADLLTQQEDEQEESIDYAVLQYLNQNTAQKSLFDILI